MIQDCINGICMAINHEFNVSSREYEIYTESVEQGMKEPCFFVLCINQNHELQIRGRYQRSFPFMIQYFPVSEEPRTECQAVMERLAVCLEQVDMGDAKIHGSHINGQVVDGILNFSVDYVVFACLPVEQSEMEKLETEMNAKE